MKKIIYTVICTVLFCNCTTQEPDIFSSSASERLSNALKNNQTALKSAQNGWVMEYFATASSPGYSILVKFNKNGMATTAAQNEYTTNQGYDIDSCLYEMIGDNGPELTFNTYSRILHQFSTPENPDGTGLEGDYEFQIIKTDTAQLILKGKKRSTNILLKKLPTNISWTNYMASIYNMNSMLFSGNSPSLTLSIGSVFYTFSKGISHVFSAIKSGVGQTPVDIPFIVTHTGLRFYSPQDFDGNTIQNFTLNPEKSALVCDEIPTLKLSGPTDLGTFFTANLLVWEFNPDNMSNLFNSNYDAIIQSCINNYNAQNVKLALKYYPTRSSFELTLSFLKDNIPTE